MKKAVLYARVSSALQEKERTIESQIAELKRQIKSAGDVLIKEYLDDGYSGAELCRPAMDTLREEIKTDMFDTIYFLNTDRIAREVTYQTIIIAEILKYKKQIIINNKDYVHNPENKFALTILGAVSELERAKIIERSMRGKIHKLKQGQVLNNGCNMYGYKYIKRTSTSPPKLVINEVEAKTTKYIFKEYVKGASWAKLIRSLENMGFKRKNGKTLWDVVQLRSIIKNHTYSGIKYYNKMKHFKRTDDPLVKIKYGKKVYRDKSEWIGVSVPAIVSKEVFDKAQQRLEDNKKKYRKPFETQLLSGLIKCGNCGRRFIAYQRYYRNKRSKKNPDKIIHKVAYVCGKRAKNVMHAKKSDRHLCKNPEVSARLIEPRVFKMIEEEMLNPDRLIMCTDYMKNKGSTTQIKLEGKLKNIEKKIVDIGEKKKKHLDLYATGKINRTDYSKKCIKYDEEINTQKAKKEKLISTMSSLYKKHLVEISIKQFCEIAKTQYGQCFNLERKRKFLKNYVDHVDYLNKQISLIGSMRVDKDTLRFSIEGKIKRY